MSVIHIENFPWSGDITSVREFFSGLVIPEGGVHILGGHKGDAFVVFSTPDDAMNALMMNGRRIHGRPVSLFISNKDEMYNYINHGKGGPSASYGESAQLQYQQPQDTFQQDAYRGHQVVQSSDRYPYSHPTGNYLHSSQPGVDQGFPTRGNDQTHMYNPPPMTYSSQNNVTNTSVFGNQREDKPRRTRFDQPNTSSHNNYDMMTGRQPNLFNMETNNGFQATHNSLHTDTYAVQSNLHATSHHSISPGSRGRHESPDRGRRDGDRHTQSSGHQGNRGVGDTLRRIQETSDGRHHPMSRKDSDDNPFSCCVTVSNVPIYLTKSDIRNKFFGECKFAQSGLKLITDAHLGHKNAYMKFRSPADTQAALTKGGRQIDNKQLIVKTCSEKEFDDAVENYIPPRPETDKKRQIPVNLIKRDMGSIIGPRPSKRKDEKHVQAKDPMLCVEASNMPNDVSARDMKLFFHSSIIADGGVKIMKDMKGKGTGKAFIKFKSKSDMEKALKLSGSYIDSCRVAVSKCTVEVFDNAVELPGKASDVNADLYVHVCNLPSDITKRDLTLFFHKSKLATDGVFIRHDSRRKGPAEAHLKFLTPNDVVNALERNSDYIEGSRLVVQRSTQKEYNQAVGISSTGMKPPSLCTLVSNLPHDVKKRDVTLFFHSSTIVTDGIKLIHNSKGELIGNAFVKFKSPKDIENALKRHGDAIETKPIAIQRCPQEDFDKAMENPKPERRDYVSSRRDRSSSRFDRDRRDSEKREEKKTSLYLRVTQLPKGVSKRDVALFFQGIQLSMKGIKIIGDRHSKAVGEVYVKFSSEKDAKFGLAKHLAKFKNCKVFVNECSAEDFSRATDCDDPSNSQRLSNHNNTPAARGASTGGDHPKQEHKLPTLAFPPALPIGMEAVPVPYDPSQPPHCVFVSNVPQECNYVHIQQFFQNCRIVPNGIKLRSCNRNLKEAYVKFAEESDVIRALRRNGVQLGHMIVGVKICSNEQFARATIMNTQIGDYHSAIPIDPFNPVTSVSINNRPNALLPTPAPGIMPLGVTPLMDPTGQIINNIMHTPSHPLVIGPNTGDTRIVQTRFDSNIIHGYSDRKRLSNDKGLLGDGPQNKRHRDMESHCVAIRNLSYNATIQDIINFLSPARICRGPLVTIKSNGMNTGKADLEFASQHDLEIAMQKNRLLLLGRSVTIIPISLQDFEDAKEKLDKTLRTVVPEPLPDIVMTPDMCVHIEGLPDYTEIRHLKDLFHPITFSRQCTHIFYFGSGKATGAAYVEFSTARDQLRALSANNCKVGSKAVTISSVSKDEMEHKLAIRIRNLGIIDTNIPRSGDRNSRNREPALRDSSSSHRPPRDRPSHDRSRDYQDSRRAANPDDYQNNFDPREPVASAGLVDDLTIQDMDVQLDYYEEGYPMEIADVDPQFRDYRDEAPMDEPRVSTDRRSRDRRSPRRGPSHRRSPVSTRDKPPRSRQSRTPPRSNKRSESNSKRDPPARDRPATKKEDEASKADITPPVSNDQVFIHVQNLNDDVQMEDLVEFMRAFGVFPEMIELQCMEESTKEEGIAMFKTSSDAQKAVKALNNRRFRRRNVKVFIGR